jgi:hypothetical protein
MEALGAQMAEVISQTRALPQPSAEEVQEGAKKYDARWQEFQQDASQQLMKLAEYESLTEAWMRAMENIR